ncbi:MAG TPA: hypothetical protein PLD05_14405 [Thermogutta sp.]|nr:hypothetical protein [Thermogutta sp.]
MEDKHHRPTDDQGFQDIPRKRSLELARHVAEIQRYQKENNLEDKGDPPDEDNDSPQQRRERD